MSNLINISRDIQTCDVLSSYSAGKFRFVTKCRAGFMTVSDSRESDNAHYIAHPEALISGHRKGALQTVQFQPAGTDYWFTVFAKNGKKIPVIDQAILADLTVGTINSFWLNTALYSQTQYAMVGAKTWADKAYVMNHKPEAVAA